MVEDKRYEYDVHGRMESKRIGRHAKQRFAYDGEHRLSEVQTVRNGVRQDMYFGQPGVSELSVTKLAFPEPKPGEYTLTCPASYGVAMCATTMGGKCFAI